MSNPQLPKGFIPDTEEIKIPSLPKGFIPDPVKKKVVGLWSGGVDPSEIGGKGGEYVAPSTGKNLQIDPSKALPIQSDDPLGDAKSLAAQKLWSSKTETSITPENSFQKFQEGLTAKHDLHAINNAFGNDEQLADKVLSAQLVKKGAVMKPKQVTQGLDFLQPEAPEEKFQGGSLSDYSLDEIQKNIDPKNETQKVAFQTLKKDRSVDAALHNSHSIEDAAITVAASMNPQLDKQVQYLRSKGMDLPEAQKGELVAQFVTDPVVLKKAETDQNINLQVLGAQQLLYQHYPEFGKKVVSQKISQYREDEGKNNPIVNIPRKGATDDVVDKMVKEGKLTEEEKGIYEKDIRPELGLLQSLKRGVGRLIPGVQANMEESPIATPGFLETAENSYNRTLQGMAHSVEDFVNTVSSGGGTVESGKIFTPEQRLYDMLAKNHSMVTVNPKGLNQLGQAGGDIAGFIAPMILGGAATKAIGMSPLSGELLTNTLMFEGQNKDHAIEMFPGNNEKQLMYNSIATPIDVLLAKAIPNKGAMAEIKGELNPEIKKIINDFTNDKITGEAAKEQLFNKITAIAKDNAKMGGVMAGFDIIHNGLDAAFGGRDVSMDDAIHSAVQSFKHGFLGNTFLSTVHHFGAEPVIGGKVLREIAENPQTIKDLIEQDAAKSPELEATKEEKLKNLQTVTDTWKEIKDLDAKQPEKEKFLLKDLQQKIFEEKAKNAKVDIVKDKYDKKVAQLKIEKNKLIDPEMGNKKFLEEMYDEDLLPKGSKLLLDDENGKFSEHKVGAYLKFIAQQANGLDENWKPTGDKVNIEGIPESVIEAANDRWKKEVTEATEKPRIRVTAKEMEEGQPEKAQIKNKFPLAEKDVSEMNSKELNDYAKQIKQHDKALKTELFGEEGRKNITPEMEEGLTEDQKNEYYGKNLPKEGVYDPIEIQRIANRVENIEESESAQEIADVIKRPLIDFSRKKDKENLAVISAAKRKAEELGIDPTLLIEESAKKVLSEFKDKDEATSIVKDIFNNIKTKQDAIQDKRVEQGEQGNEPPGTQNQAQSKDTGEEKVTGIKKAISEPERAYRNLPKVEVPKMGTDSEILQKGKEAVDKGEINPREVANRVNESEGRIYTPEEAAAMQYYSHQLDKQESELKETLSSAPKGSQEYLEATQQLGQLSDEIDLKTKADRINSNSWGRLGNVMQIVADPSFNPSTVREVIKANYGGEVPKEVQAKIDEALKQRDLAIEELRKAKEKAAINEIKKDTDFENRKTKRKQTKEELKKQREDIIADIKFNLRKDADNPSFGIPLSTDTLKSLGELAVNYFKDGVVTFEGLVDAVYSDVKGVIPGTSRKDIKDIISSYPDIRDAAREKEETRLARKETDINNQLTSGKFKTTPKKADIVYKKTPEMLRAEARIADAEHKLNVLKRKSFESQKNYFQKGLMWLGRAVRLSVLSGTNVLYKLSAAATIGSAVKRIPEQLIGGIYSQIFKGIAQKAPIEGFWNAKAEATFYKEFFNPGKFVNNAFEIAKSGSSTLTKKFGTGEHEHVTGVYIMTDLHAIIKDPPKRATFAASFHNGLVWAEKNGYDITDPLIINTLENAAYKRAQYEIFQESNGLSRAFGRWKTALEKGEGKLFWVPVGKNSGAIAKFLADFMIPVSTVPTNIARRLATTSPAGLIRGGSKVIQAYRKGIENLSNEEADAVMRQLKQGTLGTALWLVGWFGLAHYGGLYTKYSPDKKRDKDDKTSDVMEIGGELIPKPVQHALPFEVIQIGATARRVYEEYKKKGDNTFEALLKSGLASIGATAEQIPVVETGAHLVGSVKDPYEEKKLAEDIERRFVPQIIRENIGGKEEKKPKHTHPKH